MLVRTVLIVLATTAACLAQAGSGSRHDVPSEAEQREAEALMREVFKEDYAQRGPEARRTLAQKLLDEGRASLSDPVTQYVLLHEASKLAGQVGDWGVATQAVEDLNKAFKIDPVKMKYETIKSLRNATQSQAAAEQGALYTIVFLMEALKAEEYEIASDAAQLLSSFAIAAKNMELAARARLIKAEIKSRAAAYLEAKIAKDQLSKDPDDKEAKFILGTYMALYQEDWEQGLPLIAEGNDPSWAEVAKADMSNPLTAKEMDAVGDLWYQLGSKNTSMKRQLWGRAQFWYKLVVENSDGLLRKKAELRLNQLNKTAGATPALRVVVSAATRKALPTAAELQRLRSLYASYRAGNSRSYTLYRTLKSELLSRVQQNAYNGTTADFFARCKGELLIYESMTAVGDNSVPSYRPTILVSYFRTFASKSKDHKELAERLLQFEYFLSREKTRFSTSSSSSSSADGMVYNAIYYYVRTNTNLFRSQDSKLKLCSYLKSRGVRSPGLERYRQYALRYR